MTTIDRSCAALPHFLERDAAATRVATTTAPVCAAAAGNLLFPSPAIRICVLGEFTVHIDGVEVPASRNMPRVPWQLLKCLAAHGSRAVRQERLTELLWPDSDGDAAYRALITTTFRLRKLLGRKDALRFENRALSLEPTLCWVDAWEFERVVTDLRDSAALRRGLALYRGAFLNGSCDHSHELAACEHLRRKYLRAVLACTDQLVRQSMLDEAVICLETALEAEPELQVLHERLRDVSAHARRLTHATMTTHALKSNAQVHATRGDSHVPPSIEARLAVRAASGG